MKSNTQCSGLHQALGILSTLQLPEQVKMWLTCNVQSHWNFFLFVCLLHHGIWKFPGEGLNMSHSFNPHHSCGNAGSLNPVCYSGNSHWIFVFITSWYAYYHIEFEDLPLRSSHYTSQRFDIRTFKIWVNFPISIKFLSFLFSIHRHASINA